MNIGPYRLSVLLLTLFTIIGCSKEKDNPSVLPAGTFKPIGSVKVVSAELYTKDGQITDKARINSFISRQYLSSMFGEEQIPFVETIFVIKEDGTCEVNYPYGGIAFSGPISKLDNKIFVVAATDSTQLPLHYPGNPFGGYFWDEATGVKQCGQPASIFRIHTGFTNLSNNIRYYNDSKFIPACPIEYHDNNTLAVLMLQIYGQSGNQNGCGGTSLTVTNLLNSDFYKDLGDTDTTVIVKKTIMLKKQ